MARSPNYPAVSFPEAVELAGKIYQQAKRHTADKLSIAKILGYKGLSGRSQRVIGALNAYGLLEGAGDSLGLSRDAESILVDPVGSQDRLDSAMSCAYAPQIMTDVFDKFEGSLPGDQLLQAYLLKYGYSHDAVDKLIPTIKETFEFADKISLETSRAESYTSRTVPKEVNEDEESEMNTQTDTQPAKVSYGPPMPIFGNEKELFSYEFEPSGSIRLMITEDVDTEEALDVLGDLVEMKKKELERKRKRGGQQPGSNKEGD